EGDLDAAGALAELNDAVAEDVRDLVARRLKEDAREVAAEDFDLRDDAFAAEQLGRHGREPPAGAIDEGQATLVEAFPAHPRKEAHPLGDLAAGAPQVDGLAAGTERGRRLDDRRAEAAPA